MEQPINPEINPTKKIDLQFANHAYSIDEVNQRYQLSHDINEHTWDNAVKERIKNSNASCIAIDSAFPNYNNTTYPLRDIWTLLPDRPRSINQRNKIEVLAGDTHDFVALLDTSASTAITEFADKKIDQINLQSRLGGQSDLIGLFGLNFVLEALSYLPQVQSKDGRMSRRDFLRVSSKVTFGATASLLAGRFAAIGLHSVITDQKSYENFLYFSDKLGSKFFEDLSWFIDGRTALLEEKSLEHNSQETIVLLGTGHSANSLKLLQNDNYRAEKIKTYAEHMIQAIKVFQEKFPHLKNIDAVASVKDYLPRYDIITVTDPDEAGFDLNIPEDVNKWIKQTGSYTSRNVAEAIKDIK
jgi:hypothetical protein